MKNFWNKLPKPFFALAPMADVTDAAFRRIIAKYGKPDVMWTEFVACDGLQSAGREHLMRDLSYTDEERPIVAQVFGANPENFRKTAELVRELGFDGIDINMGCPEKNIEKQGAGASLIKDPSLAKEIIIATKEGAKEIPVSVKTRIGYNKNELETWVPFLLETGIDALTIHARTRKEMSDVPARWEHIERAVQIRDEMRSKTLIIGNGDVKNVADGKVKAQQTGADGIMIGRGIFGNPWLFSERTEEASFQEKCAVLLEHAFLFEEIFGATKNFSIMKKHFKAYVTGFDGAKELRVKLMETNGAKEVKRIIENRK
ncbi:MAG: tRNA-dihydrouridine synthase [Candidatus Paceibacterota bacterium]|jgi:nifR3 family TIM-barrel protein|nr:tRNA-dihydrouridine synthase [Candidatus Paceibacterota bacterium]